jgi:hypothetical protein
MVHVFCLSDRLFRHATGMQFRMRGRERGLTASIHLLLNSIREDQNDIGQRHGNFEMAKAIGLCLI